MKARWVVVANRLGLLRRWLAQPWSDLALVLALVGAAAAPTFLTASADLWARATADRIAATLAQRQDLGALGVGVETNALFAAGVATPIETITARLALIERLEDPIATRATFTGLLSTDEQVVGIPVRIMARPGAVEALTVTQSNGSDHGVWISDWLAGEAGLGVGDRMAFTADADPDTPGADVIRGGGPVAEFVVAGVYRRLWSEDGTAPADYWTGLPEGLLPRFVGPFGEPGFELLIADAPTLEASGLPGSVRWDAFATEPPATLAALTSLEAEYRTMETDLVAGAGAPAMSLLAGGAPARPSVTSVVPALAAQARADAALLAQPIGTARAAGVVLGLAVMTTAGVLMVQRRRTEFRLLAGEGDRWPIIGLRTTGQLLAPVALGAVVGVSLAVAVSVTVGPVDGATLVPVDWATVTAVAAVGLVLASSATALAGQAVLADRPRRTTKPPVLAAVSVAATIFLWLQVDRTAAGHRLDLAVVALPVTALVAAASVGIGVLGWVLTRFRSFARRLPPIPFLVWRHLSGNDGTAGIVATAVAVGIGLMALSSHMVDTLQRTLEVKIATEIGGQTRLDVFGPAPLDLAPPADSTFVRFQETRLTPGDVSVRVVAIDPATADALTWPAEFGPSLSDVVAAVDRLLEDGAVPALAVEGRPVAGEGTFGTGQPIRYRVVGTVRSAPVASSTGPTLLVAAPQVDRFEIERVTADGGEIPEGFRPPTLRYRRHLISSSTPEQLDGYLVANDLEIRESVTRDARLTDPDVVAVSLAFGYVRLLGSVAATAAGAGLLLYLSVRRRARALGSVMMWRMGFGPPASSLATAAEVAVLLSIASVSALAVTPMVAGVLARRFDPAPQVPPSIGPTPIPGAAWTGIVSAVAVVASVVWLAEWRSSRRLGAEVLRGV